jgi:hypothetical protein
MAQRCSRQSMTRLTNCLPVTVFLLISHLQWWCFWRTRLWLRKFWDVKWKFKRDKFYQVFRSISIKSTFQVTFTRGFSVRSPELNCFFLEKPIQIISLFPIFFSFHTLFAWQLSQNWVQYLFSVYDSKARHAIRTEWDLKLNWLKLNISVSRWQSRDIFKLV